MTNGNNNIHEENPIPPDQLDEPEIYDEPAVEPGPLSKLPSKKHFLPVVVCVAFFYIASSIYSNHQYGEMLKVSGDAVFTKHEYWRLFTALFVHGSLLHLLSNLFMFTIFGWLLRAYYGFAVFPAAAFIMGTITNLAVVSIYPPDVSLVGASGMIYGMAAMWIVFFMKYDTDRSFPMRALRAAGFVLAMLVPSAVEPQVSYLAHGLGFIAGIGSGLILLPFVDVRDPG
jgi:membrane associated rhomboid family serine protease